MTNKQPLTVSPTTEANWYNENVRTEGLLLRDYFAAKAMQELCAADSGGNVHSNVEQAYVWADAMIKARG